MSDADQVARIPPHPTLGRRYSMATTQQPQAQAGAATWLTPDEMRALEAVCDTLIPGLAPPEGADDPHGLYARKASDLNVAQAIAETLALESPESKADFKQ